ncbi:glycosyl hydrolase 53 family protein [candidate division KSB1 bacterium]|nr:glycosyl hydrolase 53 family protein [candidate division KSB1 bacterium]
MKTIANIILLILLNALSVQGQQFYFGCDLSYVNQMEDCGAVFKENDAPKDVYQIFASHGTNLARVRLWVDPAWWQRPLQQPEGVKPFYSDLEDVKETLRRAKAAGMQTMLGFHYSDFWADPGRQLVPHRWLGIADDAEALKDSVYNYTKHVLTQLEREGLMPDFVKIGNETNGGIMNHIASEGDYKPVRTISNDWARHGKLFNAAIKAVREVGATSAIHTKIVVHFTGDLNGHQWFFQNLIDSDVTDFDIYGFSYYYAWHKGNIPLLETTIRNLVTTFPVYKVMIVETAYPWSTENFDSLINIVRTADPAYLPVSPVKQLEYMVDYTRAVMRPGGIGVIFWEPAWLSTPCRTPWGQGSSHDHLAFFDPKNNNFMEDGAGNWPSPRFYENLDAHKISFTLNMASLTVSDSVFISGSFLNGKMSMAPIDSSDYYYFTYLPANTHGSYNFTTGNIPESLPADCSANDRSFTMPDSNIVIKVTWSKCDSTGK